MIAAAAVFVMVFAAGAVFFESSSDVDGAVSQIKGETDLVKISGSLTYQIMFYETDDYETLDISYSAELRDSSGKVQSNAVSPSSGALTNGEDKTLTVRAPAAAGKYTLAVAFKEKKDGGDTVETERTQIITVVQPVKLTAVLKNNSKVDFTDFAVYFHIDGKLIEGSKQLVTAAAGGTATVTFEWVTYTLSNGEHTFQVVAGEENIGDYKDVILGGDGKFFVGHWSYDLINVVFGILMVVLLVVVIYIYRKPVKNYGKPKSRR